MVIIDSLLVVKRKGILVVFYPVTIVSHVDAVIEGKLMIALVVLEIHIVIAKPCGQGTGHIKTGSITRIKRLGNDIHQDAHIAVSDRRIFVVFHLLYFVGGNSLQVVLARHRHVVDENLDGFAGHTGCLAGHRIGIDSRECSQEIL